MQWDSSTFTNGHFTANSPYENLKYSWQNAFEYSVATYFSSHWVNTSRKKSLHWLTDEISKAISLKYDVFFIRV